MSGILTAAGLGQISMAEVHSFGVAHNVRGEEIFFIPEIDTAKKQRMLVVQSQHAASSILSDLEEAKRRGKDIDLVERVVTTYEEREWN